MAVLSILNGIRPVLVTLPSLGKTSFASTAVTVTRQFTTSVFRQSDHERRITIVPSRYTWQKYKDMLHFYVWLGLIPGLTVVFLTNIFVGPATLSEIPKGYVPKPWEYHNHPISRWMLKYCFPSHQETYERNLHYIFVEEEKRKMRLMAWKVEALMRERGDYPNYFVKKSILSKYLRGLMDQDEEIKDESGHD